MGSVKGWKLVGNICKLIRHFHQQVSVSAPMVTPVPMVMPVPVATPTSMAVPAPLTTPIPMPTPVSMTVPGPVVVPALATMPVPMSAPIPAPVVVPASVPVQPSVAPAVQNPGRETDSPGGQRPVASLSDFLEDPRAKLHTPPPNSTYPKVNIPGKDPLDVPDTHPLRPPNPSPFESEPEEDRENARLVSIEEFLQPVPQPRIKVSFQTKSGDHVCPCSVVIILDCTQVEYLTIALTANLPSFLY